MHMMKALKAPQTSELGVYIADTVSHWCWSWDCRVLLIVTDPSHSLSENSRAEAMQYKGQVGSWISSDTQLNAFKTGKAEALEAIPNRSIMLPGWKSSRKVSVFPPSLKVFLWVDPLTLILSFLIQKLKFQLIAVCQSSSFCGLRLAKHGSMSAIRFPPERKNGKLRLH
ncbi:hypothetical protein MUK42_28102 [Musa troglodytarum]|uniref:Uncharacterized protein n=1 Tax=Musa troglodytarum TaxID=320322 RepID=A0A9E7JM10_9LILI|nr:hypothetical protein MUK42_28102 [Musa troglodytarum]